MMTHSEPIFTAAHAALGEEDFLLVSKEIEFFDNQPKPTAKTV